MGMTDQEFRSWISCDTHYWEGDDKPRQMAKEDDENLCTAQALLLLEHLDPALFAIQASAVGIVIYPRHHIHQLTTWEKTLLRSEYQIPAELIGSLRHIDQQIKERCKKRSITSETQQNNLLGREASGRAAAVASSLTRFNQRMQEFSSVGRTSATGSIPDASQSTYKAPSGARRWRRNGRHSSST